MKLNRREFVKGGLATLGFLALPGGLWAAPAGWKPKKRPNLVFGVVSDTHMRTHYDGVSFYEHYEIRMDDTPLKAALEYFKRAKVDAVVHCGDMTTVTIPKSDLPPGKVLTFRVLPSSEFGERGKPIEKTMRRGRQAV